MIQADLHAMKTLSHRLATSSSEIDDLEDELTKLINKTAWTGGEAEQFRHVWEAQFRPDLAKLVSTLTRASKVVDRCRVAIDEAAN